MSSRARIAVAVVAIGLCGVARVATAATPPLDLRPTNPQSLDAYAVTEAPPVAGESVVIHYVTSGPDAPALTDADSDSIPDYVELMRDAADSSLAYYRDHGFKAPLPDTAGPDARPDIYLKAMPDGVFGWVGSQVTTEGGSFAELSPTLDPSSEADGSLYATVAHELFHLVQYSYVPDGALPSWAAEGQASAMEQLVFPDVHDRVTDAWLDEWLDHPWRSLTDDSSSCDHCYGGSLFWRWVISGNKQALPVFLGRLYGYEKLGRPIGSGLEPLDEALKRTGDVSLWQAYSEFSLDVYKQGFKPAPFSTLNAAFVMRSTPITKIAGLSTHYLRMKAPKKAETLIVAISSAGGPAPRVTLIVGGPRGREVKVLERQRSGRTLLWDVTFRSQAERDDVMLIVTSGREKGVTYKAAFQALRG